MIWHDVIAAEPQQYELTNLNFYSRTQQLTEAVFQKLCHCQIDISWKSCNSKWSTIPIRGMLLIRNHVIRCIFSSWGDIEVSTYMHVTMRNCNICTLLGVSCTCVYKVVNIVHCNWSNRWGLAEGIITKCVLTVPVTQGSFQEVTEWYLTGNYMVSSGYQVTSTMVSKNIQEYPQ